MSENQDPGAFEGRTHRIRPLLGRDPHERSRTATTLECLYDLVIVVAIGQAADQLAHALAAGYTAAAVGGFLFAMFGILWAWVSFSWFASAFDNDDWPQRLATMVQMIGVTVLGLGIPAMFHSLLEGHAVDNKVMVMGYVVMRIAMIFQWLRAARNNPEYRGTCMTYVWTIAIAQIGWVATAFAQLTPWHVAVLMLALLFLEFGGPYLAETRHRGTPWHPHHIAERYGLLALIALGEGVAGTVASLSAVVDSQGWTPNAALVATAGMGLTFGMWWIYFLLPSGEILHAHRNRAFPWAHTSIPVLASIAATGAGLRVAALYIDHQAVISAQAVVLTLAIPVSVFVLGIYSLYSILYREISRFHLALLAGTALVTAAGPMLAASGVSMALCLLVVMMPPLVSIVGYEAHGHKEVALALERVLRSK